MKTILLKPTSRLMGNYDITYTATLPDDLIGKLVLAFPYSDICTKDISLVNSGIVDTSDKGLSFKFMMSPNVSRGNVKSYRQEDTFITLLVLDEDSVEDYNREDYDE